MSDTTPDSMIWTTAVARRHTPLFLSFLISGQSLEGIQRQTGLSVTLTHIRRSGIAIQYLQRELATAREVMRERIADAGLDFFDDFSARCLRSWKALLVTAESIGPQRLPQAGDGPAIETLLHSYFDAAVGHASSLQTMILVQFELEKYLDDFVSGCIPEGDRRATVLAALKMAVEPTHEVLNLVGILELGQLVQDQVPDCASWITADPAYLLTRLATGYPAIWERIRTYEQDYGWMGRMYYAGDPISSGDIILRLQNILRFDCAARLGEMTARREEQLAERARAIQMLDDPQAQRLADILSRYMYMRTERLNAFFVAHESAVGVLSAAGRALGLIQAEDILFLDWREILHALRDGTGTAELRERVSARRRGFEFVAVDGFTDWIAPVSETTAPGSGTASSSGRDHDLLVGVTASGGYAQGRARLILNDQNMLDMAPGEILVTTMTTPSLMLAVEKAAGIVTDEGGMLCHAAIVSREFGIPCVIGTNNATRQLRTGDTVIVAADDGKVYIVAA